MPNSLLIKISKENNIEISELEKIWEKSKLISYNKFKDEKHWSYTMDKFKIGI